MNPFSHIGRRVPKPDALPKATGQIIYGHDLKLPRMLEGKILRSPLPHARILNIDIERAKRVPGVWTIITARNVAAKKFGYGRDNVTLKGDKVRRVGDEVAAVAAADEDAACEALELIHVEYEPLPAVFDPRQALEPGAPLIHEERESNLFAHQEYGHGEVERGLDEAYVVVEDEFDLPYVSGAPMEPSFCLATFDAAGFLTIYSTTQVPFLLQRDLAEALGIPGSHVRIIQTAVGGAFGRGLDMYPFEPICALLARKTGCPVRIAYNREEEFIAAPMRQPVKVNMRSGALRDGKLWVRDCQALLDLGAYVSWGAVTPLVMMQTVGSLYRLPHARFVADLVYTNNPTTGATRGFGNPQSTFFVETQMDRLAEKLGLDPLEFRLMNANRPDETTPQGLRITSCGMRECLEKAWAGVQDDKVTSVGPVTLSPRHLVTLSRKRGRGLAATINVGGGARIYRSDGCGAIVKVDDFGRVTLLTGSTEIGQGSDAILAQIVAEELGVALNEVTVVNNDTAITPWDVGTHASRTTFIAGKAAIVAAREAKRQILETASELLKAPVESLELREGQVRVSGHPEQSVSLSKVVRARHFRDAGQAVIANGWYDPPNEMLDRGFHGNISAAYGFGAQAAEVEVDTETGEVRVLKIVAAHDVGRAINPMYVEGQIEGGIHMGLGYALTEELQVREGRVQNPGFLDYRVPTALDMPAIETHIIETDDPEGPFGAKGVGEMGVTPTAAAIANAVYDAVGVRITSLPLTPEKVLRALKEKGVA